VTLRSDCDFRFVFRTCLEEADFESPLPDCLIFSESDVLVAAFNSFELLTNDEAFLVRFCTCFSLSSCCSDSTWWANLSLSSGSQMFSDCDHERESSGAEGTAAGTSTFDFVLFLICKCAPVLSITSISSLSGVVEKVNSLGVKDVRVVTDVDDRADRSSLSAIFCFAISDMID
jgi:hypothetical protein